MKTGCSWQDLTLVGRILLILLQTSAESCHKREFYWMALTPPEAAVSLYRKLGFEEIEPYYHNPFDNVIYFGIDL